MVFDFHAPDLGKLLVGVSTYVGNVFWGVFKGTMGLVSVSIS